MKEGQASVTVMYWSLTLKGSDLMKPNMPYALTAVRLSRRFPKSAGTATWMMQPLLRGTGELKSSLTVEMPST